MYHHFNGKLTEKNPNYAIVECGGVGYYLTISITTYSALKEPGSQLTLLSHLVVREDAQLLFGFSTTAERDLFRQLINVNGVGPNTAILMLSSMNLNELQTAISVGDVGILKKIKGIGEKTAQRIIIDLKGKVDKINGISSNFSQGNNTSRHEALTALSLLGFQRAMAEKAIDKILNQSGNDMSVEELIKLALKQL